MYSSTNPNQLKKKEQWLKKYQLYLQRILPWKCSAVLFRKASTLSSSSAHSSTSLRPYKWVLLQRDSNARYKTDPSLLNALHQTRGENVLMFQKPCNPNFKLRKRRSRIQVRTVSFSFRDSLILTFVSCSKSFKHPSIETYSIKQTTVNSKKDCKVTLQSFLERYWSLSQDQVCRQEIEITANTSTWSCSFSPQRGLLCSSDNTHKPTDTSRTDWRANIYFLYWVT